jgi:hypothetical protein
MGGVLANMLKYLKEECPKVNEEICNSLHNLINTNNNMKKNRNKRPCTESAKLSD